MQTFVQWAGCNKRELPVYAHNEGGAARRGGIAHWAYPDGYIRSHYPDQWFMPYSADAIMKMAPGKHHVSHETPPDYAIGPNGGVRPERKKKYDSD